MYSYIYLFKMHSQKWNANLALWATAVITWLLSFPFWEKSPTSLEWQTQKMNAYGKVVP